MQQLSVIYFASVVSVKQKIKGRNGNSQTEDEKDMVKYKRLLDKVSRKIDQWHDEKKNQNKEKFIKDDDYIEADGSPTHFSSSDDEGGLNLD